MNETKRSTYEIVVVAIVVILAVVLGVGLYSGRARVMKARLMIVELSMLRSAIIHYKMVVHKAPDALSELAQATYDTGSGRRPFLDHMPMSKDGRHFDPFGNPYRYDPKSGWISSTTKGFERW